MTGIDTVNTERLRGHRPAPGDRDFVVALYGDERVAATLWPDPLGGPRTPEQAAAILDRFAEHWTSFGFGPWVFTVTSGEAIGVGGLRNTEVAGESVVEVLYAIAGDHWAQGYATEVAKAAVETATGVLGIDALACFTLTTNRGSQIVMERAGFRFDRRITHAGLPHMLYRIP